MPEVTAYRSPTNYDDAGGFDSRFSWQIRIAPSAALTHAAAGPELRNDLTGRRLPIPALRAMGVRFVHNQDGTDRSRKPAASAGGRVRFIACSDPARRAAFFPAEATEFLPGGSRFSLLLSSGCASTVCCSRPKPAAIYPSLPPRLRVTAMRSTIPVLRATRSCCKPPAPHRVSSRCWRLTIPVGLPKSTARRRPWCWRMDSAWRSLRGSSGSHSRISLRYRTPGLLLGGILCAPEPMRAGAATLWGARPALT